MLFRRFFFLGLFAAMATLLSLAACSRSGNTAAPVPSATTKSPLVEAFNSDWEFVRDVDTTVVPALFERTQSLPWAAVMLPHTPRLEPVVTTGRQWQGYSFYRRFFRVTPADTGRYVAVRFEGAMHTADVYLNGHRLQRHLGGYLPFTVELTRYLRTDGENCLLAKLNNQDDPPIPPGKPLKDLDFNFYGGLYRPVHLLIQDRLRITDAVEAARPAGGGVLLHYENVSQQQATLHVQTEIRNDHRTERATRVRTVLLDAGGTEVARTLTDAPLLTSGGGTVVRQVLPLAQPRLWSPAQPYLYRVVIDVLDTKGVALAHQELTTGVRTIRFAPDGFYLNGQKTCLRGTNRHQEYPYLGYALSDEMQYRDAWKIKEAGFNFVRCSHYPPSPAFLQACDELGILVMDAIPGWQFFGDAAFQRNSLQNVRDMVRRDRNHPSIVLWEAALNETDMSKSFMDQAHQAVHEELPFSDVYTCGWMDYAYDVFIPARQHAKAPDYWHKYAKPKPILLCEYGDWEYYAQNAGFNQTAYAGLKESERTSRQLRGQGERALAQQALNFQEAHNDNFIGPAVGDANWLMFDYKRGYAPDIESSGVMDMYRLPKFAFYFYQSQYGPAPDALGFGKPMVFVASYAQASPAARQVRVFSNCAEVELQLDGRPLARQLPDQDTYSNHLAHPSFTFKVPAFATGTLRAVAYLNGQPVAEHTRRTPGPAHHLQLTVDTSGRELTAGRQDAVFVYATVVDAQNTPLPDATTPVRFAVTGDAELLGDNPVAAEAGVATIPLRAGHTPGSLNLTATAEGLAPATLTLQSSKPLRGLL